MKMTIVVPCYNEAENIPLILNRFNEVIKDNAISVILVNNGSTDNSAQVLEEMLPRYPFARTVLVPVNQGYGYGIIQGLKEAEGDYIGWTHADMQTDPYDVVKAYRIAKKYHGEEIFIKGKRKGRPAFDEFFTKGMSAFESIYFGMQLNDINAQPNVFPKRFFDMWQEPPYDFSLDLYALYMAKKSGLRVIRFPVIFPERIHGESKWNNEGFKSKWKFIKRTLSFSLQLKKKMKK